MTGVGGAWRRDYDGGVVLVNPTTAAVTIRLGGTFRKIRGRQDRSVNSGALVSSVTIPSRDGIVLLRVPVVTLRASATTLSAGGGSSLRVTVAPVAVGQIRFQQRVAGTSRWVTASTRALDGSGTVTFARSPRSSMEYRAVLLGADVASRTVKVLVRPVLTLRASRASVRRGARVALSGNVNGSGVGTVALQRSIRGVWRTVRTVRISRGRFRTVVSFASTGTFRYRIRVAAATSHLSAVSGHVRISVR
jgi:hypothetical protein